MPSTPEAIGRYNIERFLASGGMGDIYLARDPMLDRLVAIKLLREGFDTDGLRERFEREARAAGRLSHPNIVTIHEFGLFEGRPFIAMEYVAGESLAALIRRREPMALTRKLEIIEGLCAGLAHAHRANIVHRDIKPANLIVDLEGSLKVLDFGIVKLTGSSGAGLTHHGVLVGTVNYMSPEQITGASDSVDHRSDVFAVGAVFYELLAYQLAFPGQMAEVLYKIVYASPEPLSRLCSGLDPEIERAVQKCLDRVPDQRYQDLTALRRDVARIRHRLELAQAADPSASSGDTLVINPPSDSGSLGAPMPDRISGLLISAQVALEGRDIDRALLICEQAAAIAPADTRVRDLQRTAQAARDAQRVEALLTEAVAHLSGQRLVEARVAVDLAIATQPTSTRALDLRQRIDQALADDERRRERARRIGAAIIRARTELERGALARARTAVDEALGLDPEHASAITLRQRIDAALALAEERTRQEEAARAQQRDSRLAAGRAALARDELAAALVAVDEAVSYGAGDEAIALRAEIAARQRDLARAAQCVVDGQARLARGELEAASALVEEGLAIAPHHAEAVLLRAIIARAVEEQRARDTWLRSTVDGARDSLRKGQYDEALAGLERVREAEPAWPGLAELLQEVTTRRAAALERRRRDEEVQRLLAQASERLAAQDLDAALLHVERAQMLDPASERAKALGATITAALEARRVDEIRRREAEERARLVEQIARGQEALAAGRIDEAVNLLRPLAAAARHEPGFVELLREAETEHARREEERRRERERAERIAGALERARQHASEDAFDAAIAAVDEALVIDGAHAEALATRTRISAAREQRVDELVRSAAACAAKGQHQRGIDALDAAGLSHPRLEAERDRIGRAAAAEALERRVDVAIAAARGRFKRRAPEKILQALEESGLQHPRIEEEIEAAKRAMAEAAQREAAAAQARQAREQSAREDKARAEQARQAREQRAREDKAQAEQARQAREQSARDEKARAEQARQEQARADQARADQARAEQARADQARADQAGTDSSVTPQPHRTEWQRPAALAAAVALVLIGSYFGARRLWSGPDVDPARTPSTTSTAPADTRRPPQSTVGPPATSPAAPPATPANPAGTPPTTTSLSRAEQAQAAATRIGQLLAQSQRERALGEAAAASAQLGDEPAFREAIRRLSLAAQGDAERSRNRARSAGAPERDAAGFAAAQGTWQSAGRIGQRGQLLDAAREYWKADALFAETRARAEAAQSAEAAAAAAAAPVQTAPRPEPPRVETPPARTPPAQTLPSAPVNVQPTSPAPREPERPQPQTPAFDPAAVQSTLAAYANGYSNRSVEGIVSAYPNLPTDLRDRLERTFRDASRYELSLGACQIVQQSATVAAASCTGGRLSIRFRSGQPLNRDYSAKFMLERRGAAWVITSVQ